MLSPLDYHCRQSIPAFFDIFFFCTFLHIKMHKRIKRTLILVRQHVHIFRNDTFFKQQTRSTNWSSRSNFFLIMFGYHLIMMCLFVDNRFYIVFFSTLEKTHCAFIVCDSKWMVSFLRPTWNIHRCGYLQSCLVVIWLVPHETAATSAFSVFTIQPCTMCDVTSSKATYAWCMCV